jgi:hypothetical protein
VIISFQFGKDATASPSREPNKAPGGVQVQPKRLELLDGKKSKIDA